MRTDGRRGHTSQVLFADTRADAHCKQFHALILEVRGRPDTRGLIIGEAIGDQNRYTRERSLSTTRSLCCREAVSLSHSERRSGVCSSLQVAQRFCHSLRVRFIPAAHKVEAVLDDVREDADGHLERVLADVQLVGHVGDEATRVLVRLVPDAPRRVRNEQQVGAGGGAWQRHVPHARLKVACRTRVRVPTAASE